jgi:cobalt/nickel transport system permease protein
MVHISDGVLSLPVLAAGWAITFILIAVALWWSKRKGNIEEEIPKLSVMTAAFFVASLVHIPVGPTSVHFILNGLVGVTLGILAYPAIFIGVLLQAVLFQHGGITTIGINTVNMGIAALIASGVFHGGNKLGGLVLRKNISCGIFGALAGGLAVFLAVIFTAFSLILTSKEAFSAVATVFAVTHIPVIVVEAVVVGSIVTFLVVVKPELIGGFRG